MSPTDTSAWKHSRRLSIEQSTMRILLSVLLLISTLCTFRNGQATTLLAMSTDDLVQRAQTIVVGRVIAVDSGIPDAGRHPVTTVQLHVERVVVGSAPDLMTLRYLGGRDGDRLLQVAGMRVPDVGEHGVYVIHGEERATIHPLVGWSQGHFLLRRDRNDELHVFSHDGRAISGFRQPADDTGIASTRTVALSSGIASDLMVLPSWRSEQAMSLADFEQVLLTKALRLRQ